MGNEVTNVTGGEVLPPVLSKSETGKLEKIAQQHYSRAQIGVVLFAADLARLQRGNAHKVRGYGQFGKYVEAVFEGVSASNAQQIVRQGLVLLKLEESGRIELNEKEENLPGTTGLRELSAISKRFGDEAMLQTWDVAVQTGRRVTSESVLAALGTFIQLEAPDPKELEEQVHSTELEDEEEDEQDGLSDKERELIDRIRDLTYELPESLTELEQAVQALHRERDKEDSSEDQKWLDSKR